MMNSKFKSTIAGVTTSVSGHTQNIHPKNLTAATTGHLLDLEWFNTKWKTWLSSGGRQMGSGM